LLTSCLQEPSAYLALVYASVEYKGEV
jgi:hypothetical protein